MSVLDELPLSRKQITSIIESRQHRVGIWSGAVRSGKGGRVPDRTAPDYDPANETKVLTPTGFKLFGDIKVGTQVCNPDGTVAKVIGVYDNGPKQFYRITMADGATVEADEDHLWAIAVAQQRRRRRVPPPVIPEGLRSEDEWNLRVQTRARIVNTAELAKMVANGQRVMLPLTNPVAQRGGKNQWPTLSPYTLGVLIGDGHFADSGGINFTSADPEIVERVAAELPEHLHLGRTDSAGGAATTYHITRRGSTGEYASAYIKREGLSKHRSWNKFIPSRIKNLSVDDRFAFVQGLMDADGSMDVLGHAEFSSVSEQLAKDLQEVLRSLGFRVTLSSKSTSYTYLGEKREGRTAYRLYIQGRAMDRLFHLPRKRERAKAYLGGKHDVEPWHRIASVEPTVIDNSRCIAVDNLNHLYVTDDYIVTHNTISSILAFYDAIHNAPSSGLIIIVGRTLQTIERNILEPMQDEAVFGPWASEVHHTRGSNTAVILGRTVHLIGASDVRAEGKLRGMTACLALVDEATLLPESFWTQLLARLSVPGARCLATTNPDNPNHFLKVDFIDRANEPEMNLRAWEFTLDDNPSLAPEYVAAIKAEFTGLFYLRNILGRWVAADGAIYDCFDPQRHVVPWGDLPAMQFYVGVGVDHGTTNPTAATLLGLGVDNVLYVVDEWRHQSSSKEARWTNVQLSEGLREWMGKPHHPSEDPDVPPPLKCYTYVDPAAADYRVQLKQDGLTTYPAQNNVLYGIRTTSALFSTGQLKISDRCPELLKEIPGYVWDTKATNEGKDQPIKLNDHSVDSVRYAIASTERKWRKYVKLASVTQPESARSAA